MSVRSGFGTLHCQTVTLAVTRRGQRGTTTLKCMSGRLSTKYGNKDASGFGGEKNSTRLPKIAFNCQPNEKMNKLNTSKRMANKEMHTLIISIYDFTVFKLSEIGCFSRYLHFLRIFLSLILHVI